MSEKLVNYSLYDNDGRVYYKWVTQQEATKLQYDKAKYYRTIQELKAEGTCNRQLENSGFQDPKRRPAAAGSKLKVHKVKWKEEQINILLTVLRPYRHTLRRNQISIEFWNKMSLLLKRQQISYTGEQLREKVRLLKQSKKPGMWARQMSFLYDAPLGDEPEPKWVDIVDTAFNVSSENPANNSAGSLSVDFPLNNEADGDEDYISLHPHDTMLQDTSPTQETLQVLRVVPFPKKLQERQNEDSFLQTEDDNGDLELSLHARHTMVQEVDLTSSSPQMLCRVVQAPNKLEQNLTIRPESGNQELHIQSALVASNMQGMSLSETMFVKNLEIYSTPQQGQVGDWWRSPSKKCSKTNNVDVQSGQKVRTPRSTPRKRNITQGEIMWPKDVTLRFVAECVKRKVDVQDKNTPLRVWKELCESLPYDWKTCKNKFHTMNQFFCKSLLKCKGVFGGVKWPYYDMFCEIHDIPNDICIVLEDGLLEDQASGPHAASSGEKMQWSDGDTELLISLYNERRQKFRSTKSGIRHSHLYLEIAKVMEDFGINAKATQCKLKMDTMLEKFRNEFDSEDKTGSSPSVWPWFQTFLKMEEGNPNLKAPYAYTNGTAAGHHSYSVQGETSENRQSNTRSTNAKSGNGAQAKTSNKSSKKLVFKTWVQDMQEKQLEAKRELNMEVRLLREGQDKRSEARMSALNNINKTLRFIGESLAARKC